MPHQTCGILHGSDVLGPQDPEGCVLPMGHEGPHEFVSTDGSRWQWETDWSCDCEHCMQCQGDYCTVYWPVVQESPQRGLF